MFRYCVDIQLKDFLANGGKLAFNGDETEICSAVNISATGSLTGAPAAQTEWAMSSVALAAASLDFFIQYLEACGEDPTTYKNSITHTTLNLKTQLSDLVAAMDRDFWRTEVPEYPGGFHDFFRRKSDGAWPQNRLVNFTLFPVFYGTPYDAGEKTKDVDAIAKCFNAATGFLPLVPGNNGFEGHDLGYLLWSLVEINDPRKEEVYKALVNGPTSDCWGSFTEAYSAKGVPNAHDLRSLETGINVSAIAKYWNLGE